MESSELRSTFRLVLAAYVFVGVFSINLFLYASYYYFGANLPASEVALFVISV